jgi:hypothetical protein
MQTHLMVFRPRGQSAATRTHKAAPPVRPDFKVTRWPLIPRDIPRVPPLRRRVRKAAARRLFNDLFSGTAGGRSLE